MKRIRRISVNRRTRRVGSFAASVDLAGGIFQALAAHPHVTTEADHRVARTEEQGRCGGCDKESYFHREF